MSPQMLKTTPKTIAISLPLTPHIRRTLWAATMLMLSMAAALLSGCAAVHGKQPVATMQFQFGQTAQIQLYDNLSPEIRSAFYTFHKQGAYTNTPVYRQLPGIFLLTGKPRLAGQNYLPGTSQPSENSQEAKSGQVGMVMHADGSVGPELVLIYGQSLTTCCEAPANVKIGRIINGKANLKSVNRGDNLINIGLSR